MSAETGQQERTPLPPYEVVCVQLRQTNATGHAHVAGITTRDPDGGETSWTFAQVIAALLSGERFAVAHEDGRESATLTHDVCPTCSVPSLQTEPIEALASVTRC
jgi:hypothetical protein